MIDKENEIYTKVRNAVLAKYENASVSSVYVASPASFPHVSVIQMDSKEPTEYRDSSLEEKFVSSTFQIDVYSNDKTKAKSQCKAIVSLIDDTLRRCNLRRESLVPVPNLNDATIYRITIRYSMLADKNYFYSA